ncbi:hypothetical protein QQS21_006174 [Conoideocrella luteorostrata]|uniref:Plant basic secretory protein n=1 Tax=Conoideocrella luteorostrata TaxID=1105319 RepID=A0AAJ0CQK0_9HYPO|nr:hypothetical protein QQS21_006174 [Conoideocrella luteorostrata]
MSPAVRVVPSDGSDDESQFTLPKLRLEFRDVVHPGSKLFFSSVNATKVITRGTSSVLRLLYRSPSDSTTTAPPTRSVTLILRDMPGVAYTTGSELDNDHKEIHFALDHISNTSKTRTGSEIAGVITHELVHCLQWNAEGTCPGGLIEGVADWVRLNCDLAPPHWKKEVQEKWDAGYQHTAYFLEYLEGRFGDGFVRRLNEKLRVGKYHEAKFWPDLTGATVDNLFKDYAEHIKDQK